MSLTKVSYSMITGAVANVLDYGADPTGVSNSTSAIQAAVISLRSNPVSILQTFGGPIITVYSSGTVFFPPGKYLISPDVLQVTQDLGLKLVGAGSRRTNNAVYGSTTLLVSGTSSGYGIQTYGNGGRGLTIEDMDICYATSAFTGSLIDAYDCPGLTLNRCYVGTYGITAGTRLQTAAACIRSTYDEFMTFNNCVFSGAVLGWWSDDIRTQDANTFGGSVTAFNQCTFYDFSQNHVYQSGARTRINVKFDTCAFNPITVAPSDSAISITNIDGIVILNCAFQVSVSYAPVNRWLYLNNATGSVHGCAFGDLTKCAWLQGYLDFSNNAVFCTDGVFVKGGAVSGKGNEFSKGTSGWNFDVTDAVVPYAVCVGPDIFKSLVTYSYYVPTDSTLLNVQINYSSDLDISTNKFSNASERVIVTGFANTIKTNTDANYSVSILSTGTIISATGAVNQVFDLPASIAGTTLSFTKPSSFDLVINCNGAQKFYTGDGIVKATATLLAADIGGSLTLRSYGTSGWLLMSSVGNWTFT